MNAKDSFGNTALHLAVMHNRSDADPGRLRLFAVRVF